MTASAYPGAELGLPERGAGSLATFPRRLVAVFIDWIACTAIALATLGVPWGGLAGTETLLPLGIFFAENVLLVSTAGTTLGHGLLGLRVHRIEALRAGQPGMPGLRSGLIRAALLCLLIPAFIINRHGQGLHDRAAGTLLLRSR